MSELAYVKVHMRMLVCSTAEDDELECLLCGAVGQKGLSDYGYRFGTSKQIMRSDYLVHDKECQFNKYIDINTGRPF